MSRAFGDFLLKNHGIIAIPDVSYRRLTSNDQFILLATDGVSISDFNCLHPVLFIQLIDVADGAYCFCVHRFWMCLAATKLQQLFGRQITSRRPRERWLRRQTLHGKRNFHLQRWMIALWFASSFKRGDQGVKQFVQCFSVIPCCSRSQSSCDSLLCFNLKPQYSTLSEKRITNSWCFS